MKKKSGWRIVFIISIIGCICCAGFLGWYLYQDYRTEKEYEQLQAEAREKAAQEEARKKEEDKVSLEEIENAEFTGEQQGEEAEITENFFVDMKNPINFDELQKTNSDIYAWIRIPDTKIDYPMAQREGDPSYYLSHDMYQQPRFAGCIYTEDCNSKDFMDPNTVIYGHNMKNQSMFQNLHLFRDKDFFDSHPDVYIYTPEGVLKYTVFASYTYDDRHIMNSFDFKDKKVLDANIRSDVSVTSDDHIITLETCVGGQTQSRYLVQAVLNRNGKNE